MNSDTVIKLLRTDNVFLTGKAGTGKSYITKEIIRKVKNTIVLGSTGMASMNIGGSTVHSFFTLGLSNNEEQLRAYDNYRRGQLKSQGIDESIWDKIIFSKLTKALKVARLIVIDEISMISKDVLDLIFLRLKQFACNRIPILVVGDFYQLPPVNAEYAFKSVNWNFITVELDKVMRTNNLEFADMQSKIRVGKNTEEITKYIEQLSKNQVDRPLKIFSKNADVALENKTHVDNLEGELFNIPTVFKVTDMKYEEQVLNSFKAELRIDPVFSFKIGARVMAVINEAPLFNGLLGTIKDYNPVMNCITLLTDEGREIIVGKYKFKKLTIETLGNDITMKEQASAVQYPLVIAAAITIHKSQGLTINKLMIDCNNIFEKGQFYVAFSRGVDPSNIQITSFEHKHIKSDNDVAQFYENV